MKMQITVLTGQDGNVLATVRRPKEAPKGGPRFGLSAREPGHKLHEIELPSHMENIQSAEKLHRALKDHLSKTSR
jgi:hypothetical protein